MAWHRGGLAVGKKRKFLVNFCLTLHSTAIWFPSTGGGCCTFPAPLRLSCCTLDQLLLCFAWVNFASVACIRFCFRFVPLLEQRKCCFASYFLFFSFLLRFVLFFSLSTFLSRFFCSHFLVTVLYFVRLCLCKHFIFIKVAFLIIFPFFLLRCCVHSAFCAACCFFSSYCILCLLFFFTSSSA